MTTLPQSKTLGATLTSTRRLSRTAALTLLIAAAAFLGLAGYVAFRLWRPEPAPPEQVVLKHTRLTSSAGQEEHPSISPDGQWIAYESTAAGNFDIFLQALDGASSINLTKDSSADDTRPAFSPDGNRIAFHSSRGGGGLFVMGRQGDSPHRLTNFGVNPAWSPDGTKIVFATRSVAAPNIRSERSEIWVVDVASGQSKRLLEGDGMDPSWSPNGRFIAFWSLSMDAESRDRGNNGASDLWIMRAEGGTSWKVTDDPVPDWCPVWSPDGRFLYFSRDRRGHLNLWRIPMNSDSGRSAGEPQSLTTPSRFLAFPRISADGKRVVYSSRTATSHIYRAAFDAAAGALAGEPEALTHGISTWNHVDPAPDGQWLALARGVPQEDLFISRNDGSGMRQLTDDSFFDRTPRWAADGKTIVFSSNRSGKYEIWSATVDGQVKQLTAGADSNPTNPLWSPDGARILFSDLSRQRNVVLFDPRKAWADQKPEALPVPPGPTTTGFVPSAWSSDGRRLAGHLRDGVAVYDLSSRTYQLLEGTSGASGSVLWLSNNQLLLIKHSALVRYDPATRQSQEVARLDAPHQFTSIRLSGDGRTLYFTRTLSESDVWMAEIETW